MVGKKVLNSSYGPWAHSWAESVMIKQTYFYGPDKKATVYHRRTIWTLEVSSPPGEQHISYDYGHRRHTGEARERVHHIMYTSKLPLTPISSFRSIFRRGVIVYVATNRKTSSLSYPSEAVTSTAKLLKYHFDRGLVDDARKLFDETLQKNVVHWTSMISGYNSNHCYQDAWDVFRSMMQDGNVGPNSFTVSSVLVSCRGLGWRCGGKMVHGLGVKCGFDGQAYVDNMLLDVYATTCRGMEEANLVFEGMVVKTDVTWTMMIAGYMRSGDCRAALRVLGKMLMAGVALNPFSCSISVRACASIGSLNFGRQLHAAAVKLMLETSIPVSNSLLDMYYRCFSLVDARHYFSCMLQKDVISWNTMISGLVRCNPHEALQLYINMEHLGFRPNCVTCCSAIAACVELTVLNCGRQVHGTIIRRGFRRNLQISNALIDVYGKCGFMFESRKLFDEMAVKDVISWTSMLNAYGAHGNAKEAIELFDEMINLGVPLDGIVFLGILSLCAHAGLVDKGLKYFTSMVTDHGVVPSQQIYGCVVDLLGRAGRVEEAFGLITKMPFKPDESIWGALLAACRVHKNVVLGKLVAEKILNLNPDETTTYVMLSNIYAANGEWDEFAKMRKMLKITGSQKEVGRSWIELRDSVCSFSVEERSNSHVQEVYQVVDLLFQHMSDEGLCSDCHILEGVT